MEKRAVVLSLLLSLAVVGVVLYTLELLQPKKVQLTYEQLLEKNREELVSIILENQTRSGGLGRYLFPLALIAVGVLSSVLTYAIVSKASIKRKDVLDLLPPDERKILEALASMGGTAKQYELVALSKMNKVKVHRVLKELEQRGVVEVVKVGKYNIVKVDERFRRLFS